MEGNVPPKLPSAPELDDVRLIVKSANQQFEDLIVHSQPSWTVRRLKVHLCQVHPSNPALLEQKLIYSGQLLNDELILKDILRSYKDVETENHIFHLVYTPKNSATRPKLADTQKFLNNKKLEQNLEKPIQPTDGLRHRNIVSSSSSTPSASTSTSAATSSAFASTPLNATQQTTPQPANTTTPTIQQQIPNTSYPFTFPKVANDAGCPSNIPNVAPFIIPGHLNNGAISEQQTAMQNWLQQIYQNYMEQCLKLANATINGSQLPTIESSIPMFMSIPPFMPPGFQNLQTIKPSVGISVPHVESEGPSTSRAARANFIPRIVPVIPPTAQIHQPGTSPIVGTTATQASASTAAQAPVPGQAPAPAPAEPVEPPQPRFPNIVQEEQDNRDWLDSFYSITRLLALLTLAYFYSSPLRCFVVAVIAFGIYLYHDGFFRNRRQAQVNNRNINNNQNINDNNAPAADAAAQAQENPQGATETNQSTAGDSEPLISSATPAEAETTTTSLIAFVRTFVVSFFASLLPETPAL